VAGAGGRAGGVREGLGQAPGEVGAMRTPCAGRRGSR
jgi:hypothetical protein